MRQVFIILNKEVLEHIDNHGAESTELSDTEDSVTYISSFKIEIVGGGCLSFKLIRQ